MIADRIKAFREMHEPERARLVQPHITLVFGVAEEHIKTVSELVETIARQTKAFRVSFDNYVRAYDPFERKHKLFLLCGDGHAQITDLHNRLYDGAHRLALSTEHPFEPHMTVATYNAQIQLELVDISKIGRLPIGATLSALELVRLKDGCLTTLKSVPFIA